MMVVPMNLWSECEAPKFEFIEHTSSSHGYPLVDFNALAIPFTGLIAVPFFCLLIHSSKFFTDTKLEKQARFKRMNIECSHIAVCVECATSVLCNRTNTKYRI